MVCLNDSLLQWRFPISYKRSSLFKPFFYTNYCPTFNNLGNKCECFNNQIKPFNLLNLAACTQTLYSVILIPVMSSSDKSSRPIIINFSTTSQSTWKIGSIALTGLIRRTDSLPSQKTNGEKMLRISAKWVKQTPWHPCLMKKMMVLVVVKRLRVLINETRREILGNQWGHWCIP